MKHMQIRILIYSYNVVNWENMVSAIEELIYSTHNIPSIPSEYYLEGINNIRKCTVGNIIYNNIITTIDPVKFIEDTFDLSFCQTYFDGKLLHHYSQTLNYIGTFINPLLNAKINPDAYYHNIALGIRPALRNNTQELLEYINRRLSEIREERIVKYTSRNFTIISKEDFEYSVAKWKFD